VPRRHQALHPAARELLTSAHRQNSGQLCSLIRPEQGQSPLQQMYLRSHCLRR